MLIAPRLKVPPCLGMLHGQPGGNALGLQPLGHRSSEIGLEGADPLLCLITLLDGLVALLAGRAMLRAESFYTLAQLISLPA